MELASLVHPWHSDADGDKYNTFLMPDEYAAVGKAVDVLAKQIGEGTVVREAATTSIDGCEVRAARRTPHADTRRSNSPESCAKYDADLSQRLRRRCSPATGHRGNRRGQRRRATGVIAGIEAAAGAWQGRLRRRGQRLDRRHRAGAGGKQLRDHRQRARLPSFVTLAHSRPAARLKQNPPNASTGGTPRSSRVTVAFKSGTSTGRSGSRSTCLPSDRTSE
jgi:hypothetical protein